MNTEVGTMTDTNTIFNDVQENGKIPYCYKSLRTFKAPNLITLGPLLNGYFGFIDKSGFKIANAKKTHSYELTFDHGNISTILTLNKQFLFCSVSDGTVKILDFEHGNMDKCQYLNPNIKKIVTLENGFACLFGAGLIRVLDSNMLYLNQFQLQYNNKNLVPSNIIQLENSCLCVTVRHQNVIYLYGLNGRFVQKYSYPESLGELVDMGQLPNGDLLGLFSSCTISRFDDDFHIVDWFGEEGTGKYKFKNPTRLIVLSNGNFVVYDGDILKMFDFDEIIWDNYEEYTNVSDCDDFDYHNI